MSPYDPKEHLPLRDKIRAAFAEEAAAEPEKRRRAGPLTVRDCVEREPDVEVCLWFNRELRQWWAYPVGGRFTVLENSPYTAIGVNAAATVSLCLAQEVR